MELKKIANLIHEKKFKEAKTELIELEKTKVKSIDNHPNLEKKYENSKKIRMISGTNYIGFKNNSDKYY